MSAREARPIEPSQTDALAVPLILVVDDDATILGSLATCLKCARYRVITAQNGNRGIAQYLLQTPDVMLCDVLMPEKDGIETILQLRQLKPDARIIAMSGGGQVDGLHYLDMAVKLGADMALEKPIDTSRLLIALRTLLYPLPAISARRQDPPYRRWADVPVQAALAISTPRAASESRFARR
jgi:DNA-binding response OmpR family regulator